MKTLFFLVLLNVSFLSLFSQNDTFVIDNSAYEIIKTPVELDVYKSNTGSAFNSDEALYKRKVISYSKMKKAGITMVVIGGGTVLVGSIMVASLIFS